MSDEIKAIKSRAFSVLSTGVSPAWGAPLETEFAITNMIIWNKGGEDMEWSYDGQVVDGKLASSDPPLTFVQMPDGVRKIRTRSTMGGKSVWVWAWQRGAIG